MDFSLQALFHRRLNEATELKHDGGVSGPVSLHHQLGSTGFGLLSSAITFSVRFEMSPAYGFGKPHLTALDRWRLFRKAVEAESAIEATRAGTKPHTTLLPGSAHHF